MIRTDDALKDLWYGDGRLFDVWLEQQRKLEQNPFYRAIEYLWTAVENTIKATKWRTFIGFPSFSNFHDLVWTLRWALITLFRRE